MNYRMLLLAAGVALAAGTAQAAQVEIRDAVARVTVIPENRSDVKVEVIRANPQLPLQVRVEGGRTIVDGDLDHRIRSCDTKQVRVRGVGDVDYADMPQVVVRTPRSVDISSNGAISGVVGRSGALKLANSGCSNWTVADVAGPAMVHASGAGAVRMGASERLNVSLSGAGSVRATEVRQGLDASLSGAGGVRVQELHGTMDARVSGAGSIEVDGGRASAMRASVSGVGGVKFDGQADSLDASISGFGGVRVKSVTGPVRKSVSGIGRVSIGDGA